MALGVWPPKLGCGRSIRPEGTSSTVRRQVAKLPSLELGDRWFESSRTDHSGDECAGRTAGLHPARQGSTPWLPTRCRVVSGETPRLSSGGRRGQHPHAAPYPPADGSFGTWATNLGCGAFDSPREVQSPRPLGRTASSKRRPAGSNPARGTTSPPVMEHTRPSEGWASGFESRRRLQLRGWANGKVVRLKPGSSPGSSPGPRTIRIGWHSGEAGGLLTRVIG